jgi:drug/metabolite transporter (DMT)-like permease
MLAALAAAMGSAAILLGVCAARRQAVPLDGPHLRHYAVAGLVGLALANLCAFTSLQHAPAGLFALLIPLSPMLTVLIAAAIGLERASARRLAGTALGLAGVALAMAPGAALPEPRLLPWALLMALTPVCYAVSNVAAVRLAPPGTPPLPLAAGALCAGALGLGLAALVTGGTRSPPGGLGWAALIAPLQAALGALAYILYFRSLAAHSGVVTSQVGYIVTLTGLGWGLLLFGEVPGWLTVPAAGLVFAGLALVTLPGGAAAAASVPRERGQPG